MSRAGCAVLVLLVLCLSTLPSSTLSAAVASPSRSAVPGSRSLHVLFAVPGPTATHAVAPAEHARVLVERGHRVTWMVWEVTEKWLSPSLPFTFRSFGAEDIAANYSRLMTAIIPPLQADWVKTLMGPAARALFDPLWTPIYRAMRAVCEEERPDVIVCDMFTEPCVDLADQLSIPFVITVPTGPGDFGVGDQPDTPFVTTGYSHEWQQQPLWHRLHNTFIALPAMIITTLGGSDDLNAIRRRHAVRPASAPMEKWAGHDVLYNGNPAWDWARPMHPTLHLVGPVRRPDAAEAQSLDKLEPALRAWLDESQASQQPVVYLALGSQGFVTEKQQPIFTAAFRSCPALPLQSGNSSSPFRVVWVSNRRLSDSTLSSLPSDVRVEKWVAQPAVLAHPAVSVFITHTGTSSVQDAISVGVPMLAMPLWGDQSLNAAKLQDRRVALGIDSHHLSSDDICTKLRRLAFDPDIRQSVNRMQAAFHIDARGARERGADIIERAAVVGTEHLIPYRERADVSFIIRYNLDVYAIGAAVALSVVAVLGVLLWSLAQWIWQSCCRSAGKLKKQ